MGRFDGQVAIVTGGGSGIGRATAERYVADGGRVAIVGRTEAKLHAVRDAAGPDAVLTFAGDHADPAFAATVAESVAATWDRIDLLFNNAGTFDPKPAAETSDDDWHVTIAANLTGPFMMSRAVLPVMRAQQRGVIINDSSTLGIRPIPGAAAYAAAKGGLNILGQALALEEAAHGIRVCTVCPGVVESPIHLQRPGIDTPEAVEAFYEEIGAQHPLGHVGTPADVAAMVLFLASDEARWVTGSVITVDGGIALA